MYDDVVDYVIRELEIRPVYGHQGTKFSRHLLKLKVEIIDTSSADDEMSQMSVAVWYVNRAVFDDMSTAEYHIIR